MAIDYLNKNGLSYFWSKLKAYFAPKAHTHNAFETKHSYTTAASAAKAWYRIADANTSQTDTTKSIHVQFILTAYNASYDAGYYERWFINAEVFGRTASIVIFGNTNAPFSQARILYENTIADLDANDRPAIDIYLNYVLANGTTKIEIEEVYNSGGWTFVADGQLAASTVPTGFESVTCDGIRNNGVYRSVYADWTSYTSLQRSNFTANFTLADNNTYRARVLNCTGTITVTVPSLNSVDSWFIIKNFNTASGVITIHPSTTSVLIDGSNADITLQPGEYIMIHSKAANAYTIVFDGRWKSQKADKGTTLSDYGITDAKIASGTITLGSNTITPLTSASTLDATKLSGTASINTTGNAATVTGTAGTSTLAWNTEVTLATIGGNAVKAKLPANPDTNTTYTIATGDANGQIKVTPSSGSAYNVDVAGLGTAAYTASTAYAAASHNQASNTINAMTGYSKPNATSAITTGDTLNQAIGKLEKAIDDADISNVVHITGTETVSGKKTFTGILDDPNNYQNVTGLVIRNPNITKGSAPSGNQYMSIQMCDASHSEGDGQYLLGRLGLFEYGAFASGEQRVMISCVRNITSAYELASLYAGFDASGNPFTRAVSTPSQNPANTDIVTRDWIPNDTRIVHTSGTETINGTKTFTETIRIQRSNPYVHFIETDTTRFTDSDNIPYQGLYFKDKNENEFAELIAQTYSNFSRVSIYVFDKNDNTSVFHFYRSTDGTETYASFPTPASNATGTQVVTAAWVLAKGYLTSHQSLANYVTLNGAQSITGAKTFTQSIEIRRGNPYVVFVETDLKKGTGVDSGGTAYQGIYFEDKSEAIVGGIIGNVYGGTDKQYWVTLRARDFRTASATDEAVVGCEYSSTGVKSFRPEPTNSTLLGTSGRRWKEIWCNQSSINTSSDERIKDSISDIPDEVLDAWGDVRWRQFKYKDAVAEKGSAARIHSGAVAQEVDRAFHAHNLDVSGYGLFLHDSWEAVEETRDDKGSILSHASPAGDEYGLRYVEALCMEAAYMRRENARLKARVASLEERLAALEMKLS